MKKIASNIFVVVTQLMVGGLFLFMLFAEDTANNTVVVVKNDNLNKMADAVTELFVEDTVSVGESSVEVELSSVEEKVTESVIESETVEESSVVESPVVEEPVVETPVVEEPVVDPSANEVNVEITQPAAVMDATGYLNNSALGFVVTTNNKTYSLSEEDFAVVASVVNCEANRSSKDDVLAVISVILNRADRAGSSPKDVVAAPNQFSCYNMYINGSNSGTLNATSTVVQVVQEALNGLRNNRYTSFRSWSSISYSNNYIVERGNRYK